MAWDPPSADFVQVNIYGETLNGLLHKGINIPYLLGLHGLNDCVVFDVPRRGQPIQPQYSKDPQITYENPRCSTPLKFESEPSFIPLLDCSLSPIRCKSTMDSDRWLESEDGEMEEEKLASFKMLNMNIEESDPWIPASPASISSSYEDTILSSSSVSPEAMSSEIVAPEVAELLEDIIKEVLEREELAFDGSVMQEEEKVVKVKALEETPDQGFALGNLEYSSVFGLLLYHNLHIAGQSRSLSLLPSPIPSSLIAPRRTVSCAEGLSSFFFPPMNRSASSIGSRVACFDLCEEAQDVSVRQSPSLMELSAAVASIAHSPCDDEDEEDGYFSYFTNSPVSLPAPLPPAISTLDANEFFDCSGSLEEFEDAAMAGQDAQDMMFPDQDYEKDVETDEQPDIKPKPRKQGPASVEVICQYKNCGTAILWRPGYGRQRLFDHTLSKHWKRKSWKCAFCKHRTVVESRMTFHHKRMHPGVEFKKPTNLETAEEAKALLDLYPKCFPGTPVPSQMVERFMPVE